MSAYEGIAGAIKVTECLLIGPSVEECFKYGFEIWRELFRSSVIV